MNRNYDQRVRPWTLKVFIIMLTMFVVTLTAGGCSDPATDDGDKDTSVDTPIDTIIDTQDDADEETSEMPCLTTIGCNLEPGYEGTLCTDGLCQPCRSNASCETDYGFGSTCDDGMCSDGCFPGEVGCYCDDEGCEDSYCIDDTCVECSAGVIGCVCDTGESCEVDGICNSDGLCEPCEQGTIDCLCNEDETCVADAICSNDGLCEPCEQGTIDCLCNEDETCVTDAICNTDGLCESCEQGTVGCLCDEDNTCIADAICSTNNLCESCEQGSIDCLCNEDDTCEVGLQCNTDGLCEICPAGERACPCDEDNTCDDGLVCETDLCVEESCVAGTEDCPCDGDTCDEDNYCGEDTLCHACNANVIGCPCNEEDGCGSELRCSTDNGLCENCPTGELDCTCDEDNTCDEDLVCETDLCVEDSCVVGTEGCSCDGDTCDDGAFCDEDGLCHICNANVIGCPCNEDDTCGVELRCGTDGLCEICPTGERTCPCGEDDTCDGDLVCETNLCVEDSCIVGTAECPCDGDTCIDGAYCGEDALCHACNADVIGCPCNENNTCRVGLRCGTNGLCENCPTGEYACPCNEDDTCDDDLVCATDLCVNDNCVVGTEECPCEGDICDDGNYCGDDTLCHVCNANAIGCPCNEDDTCNVNLVCDETDLVCRSELTCEDDFDEALGCVVHQLCDDGEAGQNAICLEICEMGFVWVREECIVVIPSNCTDTDPDSILEECEGQNRGCVESVEGGLTVADCSDCADDYDENREGECQLISLCSDLDCETLRRDCVGPELFKLCGNCISNYAENQDEECERTTSCIDLSCTSLGRECAGTPPFESCGECESGLLPLDPEDPMSQCMAVLTCNDIDCGEDEFCIENDSGAECISGTCPEGQAIDPVNERCRICEIVDEDCDEIGHTGRVWTYTRDGGDCLCETQEGYYFDTSSALIPRLCDADQDGWVVTGARAFLEHGEAAVRDNARCNLRTIDRITLQNDLDQRFEVLLCAEGSVAATEGECEEPAPMDMYEPTLLDSNDDIVSSPGLFPVYQDESGTGRALRAEELNPLTRACATQSGDFNNNGVPDIEEAHGADTSTMGLDLQERVFFHFSYYMELHRGWFEDRPLAAYDTYVIAERSRCDDDTNSEVPFALGYAEVGDSEYWRSCLRRRDNDFITDTPKPNYDFAVWSCDGPTGTCPDPGPLTLELPGEEGEIPIHSVCATALPPADGVWGGMNHHSQFRCVEIDDDGAIHPWQLDVAELFDAETATTGIHQFNVCRIDCADDDQTCSADCPPCPDGDCEPGSCEATSEDGPFEATPWSPVLHCDQQLATDGDIGFVSMRYRDEVYEAGCVDESAIWPELCPGYLDDPMATVRDGVNIDFGRLACGCGLEYGGPTCNMGCPKVLVSPDYNPSPRTGWWVCSDIVQTYMTPETTDSTHGAAFVGDYDNSQWIIRSRVSTVPHELTEMTGTDNNNQTWRIQ